MNAIPCVLHMENRVGLKLVTRLLRIGLSTHEADHGRFIDKAQQIINTTILGTTERPCGYGIPYDPKEKKISAITMDNGRTRKMVANISGLIDLCIDNQPDKDLWVTSIKHYDIGMQILLRKHDLTDAEISEFQYNIDIFGKNWLEANKGVEGVTNYIHLLLSGHIAEYLMHWRNLYVHSQQGWEALNYAVKKFFFRRTNRGGGRGSKNRLLPLARWLSRRFAKMTGATYEEMKSKVEQLERADFENPVDDLSATSSENSEHEADDE